MQHVEIKNLGPIKKCSLDIGKFTVLTGPQSNGKSTIAKAIFFFRTLEEEFYAQIRSQNPDDEFHTSLRNDLEKRMRNKFLRTFGSSWSMPRNMKIEYLYSKGVAIAVYLEEDWSDSRKNFVKFEFSSKLHEFLEKYKNYEKLQWDENSLKNLRNEIHALIGDSYETLYIPAGRSMITLLSDQLAAFLADEDFRKLDFCTQFYMRKILQLRGQIGEGLVALLQEKLSTSQIKIDKSSLRLLLDLMDKVLKGRYAYTSGEERIVMLQKDHKYVKINFASSGQQEAVWLFNIFYYYILMRRPVFVLLEEPESHLYPDSQKYMAEAMGLFANAGNAVFVTTHSPYILGEFNNLILAGQIKQNQAVKDLEKVLSPLKYLEKDWTQAVYVHKGATENALNEDDLIRNELIDDASDAINQEADALMQMEWTLKEEAGTDA